MMLRSVMRCMTQDGGVGPRSLNPDAAAQQRMRHGLWHAEIDTFDSMRIFLVIPLSTSTIPLSKTALIIIGVN
jgi:hypothetical protein